MDDAVSIPVSDRPLTVSDPSLTEMAASERAELRAVGRVLPGALTRIAAPGAERGLEPEGAWGASDASGAWTYFPTLDEALEYAGRIAQQAGG